MKKKRKAEYAQIDNESEIKKLNRVIGQVEGIRKMLEEHRKLEAVLIQCKAVHSALRSIESRIFKGYLEVSLDEIMKLDKKKNREEKVAELEDLFRHAS
jgi:DNA-binding FrmR family transcriptional regulator